MARVNAYAVKAAWMAMPDACFEVLTFGELGLGQKFISLPRPGDNSGHGGFRGSHYLFIKTMQKANREYGTPHGSATNVQRGVSSDLPDSMPVILVEA